MSVLGRLLAPPEKKSGYSVFDWPWTGTPPDSWIRGASASTVEQAVGVPALLGILRILSGAASLCEAIVYHDEPRERAKGTWQWDILHDWPGESTASAFRADIVMSLAANGNFFARKFVAAGQVREMVVLDPRNVEVRRQFGEIVYYVTEPGDAGGGRRKLTRREIIHGRVGAIPGCLTGIAPITSLRQTLAAATSRIDFERRIQENDARPGIIYKSASSLNPEQADDWIERWMARHSGVNRGKPTIIGRDDDIELVPLNLDDLQFVEQYQLTRDALCGAYNLPAVFAGDASREITYEDRNTLATFALGPFIQAMNDAFSGDRDLFPRSPRTSRMFVEHLTDALLRMSLKDRYDAYRLGRQGSWLKANEVRGWENLPPVEGGDDIQMTPVGGAVNPGQADEPGKDPDTNPEE